MSAFTESVEGMSEDKGLIEAVRLLRIYTAGRFDPWALAGRAKASCRAHVMSALAGKKTPQSKSGVNAMLAEFHRRAGIGGDCPAHRAHNFRAYCMAQA